MKFFKKFKLAIKDAIKENLSVNKIALASAIGVCISITPFYGLHSILAVSFAFLFKLNKFIAVGATLFGNPITTPFFVIIQLYIGGLVVKGKPAYIPLKKFSLKTAGELLPSFLVGIVVSVIVSFIITFFIIRYTVILIKKRNKK